MEIIGRKIQGRSNAKYGAILRYNRCYVIVSRGYSDAYIKYTKEDYDLNWGEIEI